MKIKYLITFVFLNIALCGHSQSALEDSVFAYLKEVKTPLELNGLELKSWADYKITNVFSLLEREINFSFYQRVYSLEITQIHHKGIRTYDVFTVMRNDTIIWGAFKYKDDSLTRSFLTNQTVINEFLHFHEIEYQSVFKIEDFVQRFSQIHVFGFRCGLSGGASSMGTYVSVLIKNRNKEALSLLLRDISPEFQSYGYSGLLALRENGVRINNADKVIIKKLNRIDVPINYCSGCIFGLKIYFKDIKPN